MPANPSERGILLALLALALILGLLYSVITPIFEASDELWHYPMVQHIATHWDLPVQPLTPGAPTGPWRQEASQPPLYYALGAALTAWIDASDLEQVRHLNPHVAAGEITPDGSNLNLVVHNPALERFPWRGTVLAVHLVRGFSVLLTVWAMYLTWALIHELFPDPSWLALTVAAVQTFTPMVLFIGASVNNDALIVPLCTLALLWMVRRVKAAPEGGAPPIPAWQLGIGIGLALLTKASGLGLLPLLGATFAWEAWQIVRRSPDAPEYRAAALHLLRESALAALPMLLLSGWWFYRNAQLYGDWLGLNAFYAVLGVRDIPADLGQLWAERFAFAAGYWGNFGGLTVPLPSWAYTPLNYIALVALAGCGLAFLRWARRDPRRHLWPFAWDGETAARALAWAWSAAVFVSWLRWATITWSSQGRLIFSALPLWSLGLVLGLGAWIPERAAAYRRTLALDLAAFLLGLSALAPWVWIAPAYQPPVATRATIPNPTAIRFGEALRLNGFTLDQRAVLPGEPLGVTLYWEALAPTATDHSLFIHVLGADDRILAQRDTFPGRGLVSTTWMAPGQQWAEHYLIRIPALAYAPDSLTLALGVAETATGARLPVDDGSDAALPDTAHLDAARFGDVWLTAPPTPLHVRFGSGMMLRRYTLSATGVAPGAPLTVTLEWECVGQVAGDYTLSLQVIDAQWRKAAQSDAWPTPPTSAWQVGQRLTETRRLDIAADALPGVYDLRLAFYRPAADGALEHLPSTWEAGQMPAKSVLLTRVRVQ